MTLAYLVTEGKSDADILNKLLPERYLKNTQLVVGGSKYSAQSLAGTILAVKSLPVALVIDADTDNESVIQEKSELVHQLLYQASPGIPFKVFTAVPELEAVFCYQQSVLERILKTSIDELTWQVARQHPKAFLTKNLGQEPLLIESILSNLDDEMMQLLQQHPLIQELTEFLDSVAYSEVLA
ncbi:MAG: hypothetical protein F6J96_12045 [Symploca sp. SIO1C2]|nr:hypothetical protein [Symploca sp. SIO1C2]NER48075.1 hypothetical protein [Symploca sp. SIO1A3]